MKLILTLILLPFAFNSLARDVPGPSTIKYKLPKGVSRNDYMPNTLIVKFRGGQQGQSTFSTSSGISNITVKSASINNIQQVFNSETTGNKTFSNKAEKTAGYGLDRIFELKYSGKADIETVINEVLANKNVEYAEPRFIYHHNYVPNDASYSTRQLYLNQIKATQAWDVIKNSSNVIIGIVDSGSDLDHPDLAANIFINSADPVNGVDDDADGYIDNNKGWDFIGNSAANIIQDNNPDVTSDTTDHGVHVSGIASAVSDNGIGVASAAFNAKLLIVKVGADNNSRSIYRGYEGIKYAADHGAQVINCSWGGPGGGSFGQDVINYAISKGSLIIAAAGNDNTSVPDYPSAYAGVMAVASVNSSDIRSGFSNYGDYVDVSAPGSSIFNTLNGGNYGTKSGTSMASPIVASVAALVKARFPAFNMLQVAEQIRVTADNIDASNPAYAGQLGKGRLNAFRAVTETSPGIRNQKIILADKGNGSIPSGDTLKISFDLKNFLSPANGLVLTLTSANPNVQVLANPINIGSLNTLESKTSVGPFNVYIKPGTPDNEKVIFRLSYSANGNSYTDFELFNVIVSLDYQNVDVNKVTSTITSNGRIGYSGPSASNGLGFVYKGDDLLYEAALMIGNSPSKVSNNARSDQGNSDEHFVKKVRVSRLTNPKVSFEGVSEFDDSANPNLLNIYVKHRQLAYAAAPDDKYIIAEYEVKNRNTTDISGVYIGLFTDWDIDDNGRDVTLYDAANQMGYAFAKPGGASYAGVKLLSNLSAPAYYPLSYMVAGDPLENGGFSIAEKYQTLSSGIKSTGLGDTSPNGLDVMFTTGSGPYTIPANGSVKVAFALIGGDNLNDLQASAQAAQNKYNVITAIEPLNPDAAAFDLKQNYPNPAAATTVIQFSIPEKAPVILSLYDVNGKKLRQLIESDLSAGTYRFDLDVSQMESGMYFYKMRYANTERTVKMQVIR